MIGDSDEEASFSYTFSLTYTRISKFGEALPNNSLADVTLSRKYTT